MEEKKDDIQNQISSMFTQYSQFYDLRCYAEAINIGTQLCELIKENFGENDHRYGAQIWNMATLYYKINGYAKAEHLYQQALFLKENHPDYADSLNSLAVLYMTIGNYAKAEPLYLQALEIIRKTVGDNHDNEPEYATSLNNLGLLYVAMGRQAEGMNLMKQEATIYDDRIDHIFSIGSERQRMLFLQFIAANLHTTLSVVLNYVSPENINRALDLVLRRKAIVCQE